MIVRMISCDVGVPIGAPTSKMIAVPVLSSLIGAGGSILGGLLGKSSNDNTNSTNLMISRETNQLQRDMFDDANSFTRDERLATQQWNLDQWNRENEYNSPAEQVARLRAAGLNPNLMLNGGNAGQAASLVSQSGSSVGTPSLNAANIQPYDYSPMMMGLSRAVDSFFDNSRTQEEANLLRLQQLHQVEKDIAEINSKLSQSGVSDAQREVLREELSVKKQTHDQIVHRAQLQNNLVDAQTYDANQRAYLNNALGYYQERVNGFADKKINAEIQHALAEAAKLYASARLDTQTYNENKETWSKRREAINATIDQLKDNVEHTKKLNPILRQQAELALSRARNASDWDEAMRWLNAAHMLVGDIVDVAGAVTKFGFLKNAKKAVEKGYGRSVDYFDGDGAYTGSSRETWSPEWLP